MRRGRLTLAIVVVAVLALPAAVEPASPPPPRPSAAFWPPPVLSNERAIAEVVRVDSRGGGAFATGTGISVGAHVVLTNAHVTRNPVTLVTRCGDQQLNVDRIERSDVADVALLVTAGPSLLPVALADADPVAGAPILFVGYPGGRLALGDGRVEGTLRLSDGSEVLRFSPPPEVGQSGSPLLDVDGRIAGLVYARDDAGGQGLAIPVSRLRAVLDQARVGGVPVADAANGDPATAAARSSLCG